MFDFNDNNIIVFGHDAQKKSNLGDVQKTLIFCVF